MTDENVSVVYQSKNSQHAKELEDILKHLTDSYNLIGTGEVVARAGSASSGRSLIISPRLGYGSGKIDIVRFISGKTPAFLETADTREIKIFLRDNDDSFCYTIEFSLGARRDAHETGFLTGDVTGRGTLSSNIKASLATLVEASPERVVLQLTSDFLYKFKFGGSKK